MTKLHVAIIGAGATGCILADKLLHTGAQVTLVARGETYRVIHENGFTLTDAEGERQIHCPIVETSMTEQAGAQDIIIIATKAFAIESIAPHLPPMYHDETIVVPACNGLPWWFLQNHPCPVENVSIDCLDPQGVIARHIPFHRVVGGLFYMAGTNLGAGKVHNGGRPRFVVGEPNGTLTFRTERLHNLLQNAGFIDPIAENIRSQILLKLCWNVAFNPIATLTRKNSIEMAEDESIMQRARNIMEEMRKFAFALNVPLPLDIEHHLLLTRKAGAHKPSMLQDAERGKPIEIDAIIGSVCEVADALKLPMPETKKLYQELLLMPIPA